MNLTYTGTLEPHWDQLASMMTDAIDQMASFVTVNAQGQMIEKCEPYVQLARLPDGGVMMEAVSDNYLETPLSMRALVVFRYMQWLDPDTNSANYYITLPAGRPPNHILARFLILTLRDVYGATPYCSFDISFE